MMVEGIIATFVLAAFALYGMLRVMSDCFVMADDVRDEDADRRTACQERIRGGIHDAVRLDDPLVRYELVEAIAEYRRAS